MSNGPINDETQRKDIADSILLNNEIYRSTINGSYDVNDFNKKVDEKFEEIRKLEEKNKNLSKELEDKKSAENSKSKKKFPQVEIAVSETNKNLSFKPEDKKDTDSQNLNIMPDEIAGQVSLVLGSRISDVANQNYNIINDPKNKITNDAKLEAIKKNEEKIEELKMDNALKEADLKDIEEKLNEPDEYKISEEFFSNELWYLLAEFQNTQNKKKKEGDSTFFTSVTTAISNCRTRLKFAYDNSKETPKWTKDDVNSVNQLKTAIYAYMNRRFIGYFGVGKTRYKLLANALFFLGDEKYSGYKDSFVKQVAQVRNQSSRFYKSPALSSKQTKLFDDESSIFNTFDMDSDDAFVKFTKHYHDMEINCQGNIFERNQHGRFKGLYGAAILPPEEVEHYARFITYISGLFLDYIFIPDDTDKNTDNPFMRLKPNRVLPIINNMKKVNKSDIFTRLKDLVEMNIQGDSMINASILSDPENANSFINAIVDISKKDEKLSNNIFLKNYDKTKFTKLYNEMIIDICRALKNACDPHMLSYKKETGLSDLKEMGGYNSISYSNLNLTKIQMIEKMLGKKKNVYFTLPELGRFELIGFENKNGLKFANVISEECSPLMSFSIGMNSNNEFKITKRKFNSNIERNTIQQIEVNDLFNNGYDLMIPN